MWLRRNLPISSRKAPQTRLILTTVHPNSRPFITNSDLGDYAVYYQIQVSASSTNWSILKWDSAQTLLTASTTDGQRSQDITYGGDKLASSTTYYWRMKFWDDYGTEGSWSTTTASFKLRPTTVDAGNIQDMRYTYDNVGNITQIADYSQIGTGKVADFAYDKLYRLTHASTSAATSTGFSQRYAYDGIGNITDKSDQGRYAYGETGFATPHAVTTIATIPYTYDNNGNVTSAGPWAFIWDYRNRLMEVGGSSAATTTHTYDHTNLRVTETVGATTTIYTNKYFNTNGTTSVKHIFTPWGENIGTVIYSTTTSMGGGGDGLMVPAFAVGDSKPSLLERIARGALSLLLGTPETAYAYTSAEKSAAIVEANPVGTYTHGDYEIEVRDILQIPNGIQYFARAWKDDQPIGFGKDGSVEWERFRIFNPRVKVPDGTKQNVYSEILEQWIEVDNFEEDPAEALRLDLSHTISLVGKESAEVVEGKIGNTTDTFYPNANPKSTSVDGRIGATNQAVSWSTLQGASSQTDDVNDSNSSSGELYAVGRTRSSGNLDIVRAVTFFDTSAISSGDNIDSATMSLYVVTVLNQDTDDGDDYIGLVQAKNGWGSATAVASGDYDQVGDQIDNPTQGATAIDLGSMTTSAYNDWTLNATGRGWIARSGETKPSGFVSSGITALGFREGHDIEDTGPLNSNTSNSMFSSQADVTGTTQDPKLVVVHSPSNVAPSEPTDMLTEGVANPVNVTDNTPEFSAIYNDADVNDIATDVEIEVSASSTAWTSLLWDTGKTTLASSTVAGNRIADVSYAGSALSSTTSYYSRIRFWDDSNATGTWSTTTASFVLATIPGAPDTLHTEGLTNPTDIGDSTPEFSAIFRDGDIGDIAASYRIQVSPSSSNWSSLLWDNGKTALASSVAIGARSQSIAYAGSALSSTTPYYWRIKFWDDGDLEGAWSTETAFFTLQVPPGEGSGTLFFTHLDHLGGTHALTDWQGNVVQAIDYYPFGRIRINSTSTAYDEKRKFTGHEYDSESDLTYAQQRYYEQDVGKFLSVDPAARDNPGAFLGDPQQQNYYAYARNNPLVLVDRMGTKVEVASKSILGIGAHTWLNITPDNPADISIDGVPAGTERFTLGAYNSNIWTPWNNTLLKGIGFEGAEGVSTDFNANIVRSSEISRPEGMTDTQFINHLGSEFIGIQDGQEYLVFGSKWSEGHAVSNNFVYELGSRVGIESQISDFKSGRLFTPGQTSGLSGSTKFQNFSNKIESTLNGVKDVIRRSD